MVTKKHGRILSGHKLASILESFQKVTRRERNLLNNLILRSTYGALKCKIQNVNAHVKPINSLQKVSINSSTVQAFHS